MNSDTEPGPAELRRFQVITDNGLFSEAIVIAHHFRVVEETGYLYFYKYGVMVAVFRHWNSVSNLSPMKDRPNAVWGQPRD